jgi:hypothetical protein
MRKGAFLLAIATAKRASELVSLLSDANHFRWEGENICFTPSRLTKTDRPGHLSPPFSVKPWKEDLCICPVETVRLILLERNHLCLQHDAIFFQLDTSSQTVGRRCFQPLHPILPRPSWDPGNFRFNQVCRASAALARGASLGDVLRLDDWSNASTYFRFYHAL